MTYNVFGGTLNPAQSINSSELNAASAKWFASQHSTQEPVHCGGDQSQLP